jgi:hypothetical protein
VTQFPHDQLAKDLLETLLSPFGEVQTAKTIDAQVREIDVYFTPAVNITPDSRLGLLHKLASNPATFEPFSKAVTIGEVRSCIAKLIDLHKVKISVAMKEKNH